ncbi:MAG: glycosyltransferase [Phycisphaerae bacterium]|nr:glycosyltransferase [Phycisphaerae bacterium]
MIARPTTVAFADFWPNFAQRETMLHRAIHTLGIKIVEQASEATVLIHADFGSSHRSFTGRRIYFSGENVVPDPAACDFAITSAFFDHERHDRLPYWAFSLDDPVQLIRPSGFSPHAAMNAQSGFCSFIASNPRAPERNRFFRLLSRRRQVSSGGRAFNTMRAPVKNKSAFLATHRFTICFENTSSPGYTTEKLVDAFLAGTIPIYWGNAEVGLEFNRAAMLHAADFPSLDALADRVMELDDDEQARLRMLSEPCYKDNRLPDVVSLDRLCAALDRALALPLAARPLRPINQRLRSHCYRSPLHQSAVSLMCRCDALLWKLGVR